MRVRRSRDVLVLALLVMMIASPTAAVADDSFAAIAYSDESGAVGYSNDYDSRAGAEQRALAECGSGCKVVLWFKNACGALATGDDGWGTGWASTRGAAESTALTGCSEQTKNCTIERWVCTSR